LAQQTAVITQIERKLTDCNLIAPGSGIILTRSREVGAIVQPGETVFTLTLTSPVWVRTYVNEHDLGIVRPGLPAAVTTDTNPDRPNSGHIGFISPTAEFTPKTVEAREIRTSLVYRPRVVVDSDDGGRRQGMPVTVRLKLPAPRKRTLWQRLMARNGVPRLCEGEAPSEPQQIGHPQGSRQSAAADRLPEIAPGLYSRRF
jgi:HlyD family secretion protein